ncbi:kinase-like domain-containing protein [Amanita rubescens]|nr:kinase-like domain-containing protein [Amanita rubescens]
MPPAVLTSQNASKEVTYEHDSIFNPSKDSISQILERLEWAKVASCKPFATFHDLRDGRCVKHDVNYLLEEAQNFLYIRQNTSIPVPRVLMAFEQDGVGHLVMECVGGKQLAQAASDLTPEQLQSIAIQLADIVQQIRHLPLPIQVLGDRKGHPYRNDFFTPQYWEESADVIPAEAFRSIEEFHNYWLSRSGLYEPLPDIQFYSIVPAHGDLSSRNILVRGGTISAIVDWDTFGLYPDYWEAALMDRGAYHGGWRTALRNVTGVPSPVGLLYNKIFDKILEGEPR